MGVTRPNIAWYWAMCKYGIETYLQISACATATMEMLFGREMEMLFGAYPCDTKCWRVPLYVVTVLKNHGGWEQGCHSLLKKDTEYMM